MSAAIPTLRAVPPRFSETVRRHKDGSVLLSIEDDRICKLNNVGTLTWMLLEEAGTDLDLDEVVRRLEERFELINAEGEFSYEVSPEQLHTDTASFLTKLVAMNLLRPVVDTQGRTTYRISESVSGTTSNGAGSSTSSRESENRSVDVQISRSETLTAFLGLLAFDLLVRLGGFGALIERVHRWPIAEPRAWDFEICRRVRAMVDRAQVYYPKKAVCLQHSAVVTCLLRRRGVPAEMVLAAQEFPIRVHAWCEVDGHVVNDKQNVKSTHREMRRV